jgi:transcriptional regulator with GAF, ATPase, and Fis domain
MDHEQRCKKLRALFKHLNRQRKIQAQKIDILCNDIITAQKDFIGRLNTVHFTAQFYETIMGTVDLQDLLAKAGELLQHEINGANAAFFLRRGAGHMLHVCKNQPITDQNRQLENYFNTELVDNVCKSNAICTIDDLFEHGLEANPAEMKKLSAASVPLSVAGKCLGFILLYRLSDRRLTSDHLTSVCSITRGLSQAIAATPAMLSLREAKAGSHAR